MGKGGRYVPFPTHLLIQINQCIGSVTYEPGNRVFGSEQTTTSTMLIGFASAIPSADGTSDADILREAACDRVYSAEHGVLVFEQLMDYLRPGDVAVVTSLAHIGSDIEAIVSTVSRLHEAKIGLHVVGSEVVPGTPVGDSFPQACAILMQHQVQWAQLNTPPNSKARARGRPPVLSAETKIRIEQMLRARRLSDLGIRDSLTKPNLLIFQGLSTIS